MAIGAESSPNPLSGRALDRRHEHRQDPEWLAAHEDHPEARYHLVWRGRVAMVSGAAAPVGPDVARAMIGGDGPVLLGTIDETVHWAVDVSHLERDEIDSALAPGTEFGGLREAIARLHPHDANVLAFASAITTWHARHRFCGSCGTATQPHAAGHERRCPACGALHFPRTDPAVIMLVSEGDRCILGRQAVWPAGFYSTLAGFVEPGESFEDAVAREVREEVGVEITDIRYHSSQPWPFPQSVMVGFHATYVGGELRAAPDELEEARWFERSELLERRAAGGRGLAVVPPLISIASRLITAWMDGEVS